MAKDPPQDPLQKGVLQALTALYEPGNFSSETERSQAFVDGLRAGRQSPEYAANRKAHQEAIRFIQIACFIRHSQVDLGQYCEQLVKAAVGPTVEQMLSDVTLSLGNFWRIFRIKNTRLNQLSPEDGGIAQMDRLAQMTSGEAGFDFDPSRKMNASHRTVVAKFRDGRMLDIIRTSTPAKHTGSGAAARLTLKALDTFIDHEQLKFWEDRLVKIFDGVSHADTSITPDYRGFIEALPKLNRNVLHVNLEARTKSRERPRWESRCNLDSEHFSVLALGLDGNFFHGKKGFIKITTFAQLRLTLANRMIKGPGNYFLSRQLNIQEDLLITLFTQVHEIFFDSRENLNRSKDYNEYQAYSCFCYVYLTVYLLKKHRFSILAAGCTDNIDRGGAFRFMISMFCLHLIGKQNDPAYLNRAMNDLLSAPLIVKKQGVLWERAELVDFALHVFNHLKPGHIQKLRQNFSDWGLVDLVVPQVPDQGILPSGRTSLKMEEYQAFLQRINKEEQTLSHSDLLGTFSTCADYMRQIRRDGGLIYVDSPTPLVLPGIPFDDSSADIILQEKLTKDFSIDKDNVKRIMQGSHQGLADVIFRQLSERFNNSVLKTQLSSVALENPFKITLTYANGVVSIQMRQRFQVTTTHDKKIPLVFIDTTTTIANHKDGDAEIWYKITLP